MILNNQTYEYYCPKCNKTFKATRFKKNKQKIWVTIHYECTNLCEEVRQKELKEVKK